MTAVRRWLWLSWVLVLVMIVLGGVTRLTESGLSIVDWRPIVGTLPPTSEADWNELFERYKTSPQYEQVNAWMQLADFQRIFFWEYVHRLAGRLVGFAFLGPWLWFVARRVLTGPLVFKTLAALALGGAQGLLGWLMVKSGLSHEPHVSPLLLAAHLVMAFGVGQWLLWMALDLGPRRLGAPVPGGLRTAAWVLVGLIVLQCAYGALMAGTRAGLLYATFPDMNGRYLPAPFFFGDDLVRELLLGPAAIHWVHRALGFFVLAVTLAFAALVRRTCGATSAGRLAVALGALVLLQLNLGALVVVMRVAIPIAVVHQVTGYLVLSLAVTLCHRLGEAARAGD